MTMIEIQATVLQPVQKVWQYWNEPSHIIKWNAASEDWHTTKATNDLRVGGKLQSRMEAKDGSMGFDFGGIYDEVTEYQRIAYTLGDGRKVEIDFVELSPTETKIIEKFEPEQQNDPAMQQAGWQAILNNFKSYAEAL